MKPQDMTTFWWCVEGALLALFTGFCMATAHLHDSARRADDRSAQRWSLTLLLVSAVAAVAQLSFFLYAMSLRP